MSQGDPNIVAEFKQVAERISAGLRHMTHEDKEAMYLSVFLANTEFRKEAPQADQLNSRAAEFAEKGRLVRAGWMLTRQVDSRGTSWVLGVAP